MKPKKKEKRKREASVYCAATPLYKLALSSLCKVQWWKLKCVHDPATHYIRSQYIQWPTSESSSWLQLLVTGNNKLLVTSHTHMGAFVCWRPSTVHCLNRSLIRHARKVRKFKLFCLNPPSFQIRYVFGQKGMFQWYVFGDFLCHADIGKYIYQKLEGCLIIQEDWQMAPQLWKQPCIYMWFPKKIKPFGMTWDDPESGHRTASRAPLDNI